MVEWIFELNIFEVQNTQGKGIWDTHSFKRDYNVETKCKFSIDTIFRNYANTPTKYNFNWKFKSRTLSTLSDNP